MALSPSVLVSKLIAIFQRKAWRERSLFQILEKYHEEVFTHLNAELEITDLAKAFDNFDKTKLNRATFTVLTSRTSSQASYAVAGTSDEIVLQDTGVGAGTGFTVTLPSTPFAGQHVLVKDTSGNALTRNITIQGNGNNVEGAGSLLMNTNYAVVALVFDGSDWFVV